MPKFSKRSLEKLATCEQPLQDLFNEVIKEFDCIVLCGHRTKEEQNEAFRAGFSKLKWPMSKHNTMPSQAVDVCPYPVNWKNIARFKEFAIIVKKKAQEMGINIEHGGDWKMRDYPHWQI